MEYYKNRQSLHINFDGRVPSVIIILEGTD